jgi:hypothetical protein
MRNSAQGSSIVFPLNNASTSSPTDAEAHFALRFHSKNHLEHPKGPFDYPIAITLPKTKGVGDIPNTNCVDVGDSSSCTLQTFPLTKLNIAFHDKSEATVEDFRDKVVLVLLSAAGCAGTGATLVGNNHHPPLPTTEKVFVFSSETDVGKPFKVIGTENGGTHPEDVDPGVLFH